MKRNDSLGSTRLHGACLWHHLHAPDALNLDNGAYFLSAHLNVTVPGIERGQAQELIEAAHQICPYSKAVHGNIEVKTTLA